MTLHMQNPGVVPGVSRDLLGSGSQPLVTPMHFRAQWLASRFCLSPSIARQVSSLHFGEMGHD